MSIGAGSHQLYIIQSCPSSILHNRGSREGLFRRGVEAWGRRSQPDRSGRREKCVLSWKIPAGPAGLASSTGRGGGNRACEEDVRRKLGAHDQWDRRRFLTVAGTSTWVCPASSPWLSAIRHTVRVHQINPSWHQHCVASSRFGILVPKRCLGHFGGLAIGCARAAVLAVVRKKTTRVPLDPIWTARIQSRVKPPCTVRFWMGTGDGIE